MCILLTIYYYCLHVYGIHFEKGDRAIISESLFFYTIRQNYKMAEMWYVVEAASSRKR